MSGLPPITCGDGTWLSIQGGSSNYSAPRIDNAYYSKVEVLFSEGSHPPKSWDGHFDGHNTAEYVPVEMVREYIEAHGGLASGDPPQGIYPNDHPTNQVRLVINGNDLNIRGEDLELISEAFNTWFATAHEGNWCEDPEKATNISNTINKAVRMLLRNKDGSMRPCI